MKKPASIWTGWTAARAARARLRAEGARLVFTNGVFDLLHVGHLRYLHQAAAEGDVLWVGLNSDHSVRTIKGHGRPLLPWEERAELLAALRVVDGVIRFDGTRADALIRAIEPDLYLKGGDYTVGTLPEAATAKAIGAEIKIIPYVEGRSTSQIIESIVERYGNHDL